MRILAWLGEGDKDVDAAFEFLSTMSHELAGDFQGHVATTEELESSLEMTHHIAKLPYYKYMHSPISH